MIPSIEKICYDLAAGLITVQQAIEWLQTENGGKELRDSFAIAALPGVLAALPYLKADKDEPIASVNGVAELVYKQADAMLLARSKL